MVAIGDRLPDIELRDLHGEPHMLAAADGHVKVIILWSAECPAVRLVEPRLASLQRGWPAVVSVLFVAPNANEPREMLQDAARAHSIEPLLVDDGGRVADRLGGTATPQAMVIDGEGCLRYRGAVDDSTMRQREPTRHFLADAVMAVLAGGSPEPAETPTYGCVIVREIS
ncbi:MAG TPA: redoxin family protein [Anaerolineales bacterium]|nr:redoxin family protein [Anaerolineales bacterium]